MGVFDRYRRFREFTPDEERAHYETLAAARHSAALARTRTLDLSGLTWPELPPADVASGAVHAARRGLAAYEHSETAEVRALLATQHDVDVERVVLGQGLSELLLAAAAASLAPGERLVTGWPSHPLFPLAAARTRAELVVARSHSSAALAEAARAGARVVAIANPNDVTGALIDQRELDELLGELPDGCVLLLDQALAAYCGVEPADAVLELQARGAPLIAFRTFSKEWGLAGLRAGYALLPPSRTTDAAQLAPPLGISTVATAALRLALRAPAYARQRAELVVAERARIVAALGHAPLEVAPSQSNLLWIAANGCSGDELAEALAAEQIEVLRGSHYGDERHVRAQIQLPDANNRLLAALAAALPV